MCAEIARDLIVALARGYGFLGLRSRSIRYVGGFHRESAVNAAGDIDTCTNQRGLIHTIRDGLVDWIEMFREILWAGYFRAQRNYTGKVIPLRSP